MSQNQLGGNRIGAGGKMNVDKPHYNRSTHSLSYVRRTTAAPGVVVPFFNQVGLPEDRWHIKLNAEVLTLPTTGPLFGSFILDLHMFQAPMRLYIGDLHMNLLEVGNDMSAVKIPQWEINSPRYVNANGVQIEPSTLAAHLDIMGLGRSTSGSSGIMNRRFNALPMLSYYDIIKCYFANKQETNAMIIHTPVPTINQTVTGITSKANASASPVAIPNFFAPPTSPRNISIDGNVVVSYTGTNPNPQDIMLYTYQSYQPSGYYWKSATEVFGNWTIGGGVITYTQPYGGIVNVSAWQYSSASVPATTGPQILQFPLKNIDQMRINLLKASGTGTAYIIGVSTNLEPYSIINLYNATDARTSMQYPMEGLALKTYQSDIFNNWLKTSWVTSITNRSAVTITGGQFTMDQLNFAQKQYDLLVAIAASGGTYDDWIETAWDTEKIQRAESPIYEGGLRKEVVFQEVIATASNEALNEPLGQLGGRGTMSRMHKGGEINIKVDEPSTILGVFSLTPRIDYSQGNKWDTNLKTLDDLHKPAFDQIGFQDLITDGMYYLDTEIDASNNLTFKSAGKQPAWINYMTMYNQLRGNFAIDSQQMYMVLARRYQWNTTTNTIQDLTTYIDPSKYNYIFADARLDAQNFWVHIGIEATVRRKMSAKIMPQL